MGTPASEAAPVEEIGRPNLMSTPTEIVSDFLQNTAPDKVEAAARRLVADDATYISLNFDSPELKRILPLDRHRERATRLHRHVQPRRGLLDDRRVQRHRPVRRRGEC